MAGVPLIGSLNGANQVRQVMSEATFHPQYPNRGATMKFPNLLKKALLILPLSGFTQPAVRAEPLSIGQKAPLFQLVNEQGQPFDLASRAGQGWTVLYFYPKAGTPGCTTQACAFRDAIKRVRDQEAEVYGISTDDVPALANFHQKHRLNFTLLSDPDAKVTEAYGVKMPVMKMAKRWTFILDPNLMIRDINDDVDPALDAQVVAERIQRLKAGG
ncbi:MAG: peroxiredoxin [Methylococcus sp.]